MDDGVNIYQSFEEVTVLLTQSTLSAPQPPLSPEPLFNPPSEWRWAGLGVAIRSGMVPFFQSLDPGYLSPSKRQQSVDSPAFTLGSAEDSGFLQGVELAARLVSPCTGLPEGISNMVGSAISASAAFRFVCDQWTAMTDSAIGGEPTEHPVKNDREEADIYKRQHKCNKATATVLGGQLPKVAVALGAMSCLTPAAAQSVIEVADAETLGKIGRDPNYPLNGHYQQSSDIDGGNLSQAIGNQSDPFTGRYDGQCHTIGNLQHCLMQTLKNGGHVDSLRFTGANINSTETAGVVACEILDDALASNIQVEDAYVATRGDEKFAGIGAGYVRGAVANMTVVNGTVTTSGVKAHAGISAGKLAGKNSTVTGTGGLNCRVTVSGRGAEAGIGAGHVMHGTVNQTMAAHSSVEALHEGKAALGAGYAERGVVAKTMGVYCHAKAVGGSGDETGTAAIGVGTAIGGEVLDTIAIHCEVEGGRSAIAGIGAGVVRGGTVARVAVVNSRLKCQKSCGIGAGTIDGQASLHNTTSVNSTLTAPDSAKSISAGIGVGDIFYSGTVSNTTGVDSKLVILNARASIGIGAGSLWGFGSKAIRNTVSVNCEVISSSSRSTLGIGAGYMQAGKIMVTTGLSSRIRGNDSSLGIGVGERTGGTINHVRAIDCTMEDFSDSSSINWKRNLERCNVRVNDKQVKDTPFGCDHSLDNLCKYAAPCLVDADCKPNNRLLMDVQQAFENIRHSHPLQPDFLHPQQVSQFGVCWTKPPLPTDKVTSASNTEPVNISAPVNISTPGSLHATAAPLATGLSGVALAGIALGAVAAGTLVAGGAYAYYRYNRSDNS